MPDMGEKRQNTGVKCRIAGTQNAFGGMHNLLFLIRYDIPSTTKEPIFLVLFPFNPGLSIYLMAKSRRKRSSYV